MTALTTFRPAVFTPPLRSCVEGPPPRPDLKKQKAALVARLRAAAQRQGGPTPRQRENKA